MGSGPSAAMQASVLALNRLYLAIHVVSARRAFCLLCKGLAEVVHLEDGSYMAYDFDGWREFCALRESLGARDEAEDWISAVNFEIQVPRVIRLLSYDRLPRSTVKFSRRNIFLRDEHRCQYCGRRFSIHNLSLDHVVPRSRGGRTTWENIVAACLKCNVRKGGRTPHEAGMALCRPPIKPAQNPVLAHQLRTPKYACWKNFL